MVLQPARRLVAQILMVAMAAAMLMTWASTVVDTSIVGTGPGVGTSINGTEVDAGRLAIAAAILTILLVQVDMRPAWAVAGFSVVVLVREFIDVSGQDGVKVGAGLPVGIALALAATVILAWDLMAAIERPAEPET